ncbi:MAG: right-handed parallel beta-helix repeat-containing protein [bacterium]
MTVLDVTDYGARPGSRENAIPCVAKAVAACRGRGNATLVFPRGRYDFWAESPATVGIELRGLEGVTLDGDGSEFVCHGRMAPIAVSECRHMKLMNFVIDWDRPLTSQAVVEAVDDEHLDIIIDPQAYPYVIEDGKLRFVGEGWKSAVVHYCLFDKTQLEIVPLTRDGALGDIFDGQAEALSPGRVRLHGRVPYKPDIGTYLALYGQREMAGITLSENLDTVLENIRIHYAPGGGVLSFMCDGLYFNAVNVEARAGKGRVFSALADAFYFPNCRGLVRIENCAHTGQTDDWANFRGTYTMVIAVQPPNRVEVKVKWGGRGYYHAGDEICFVDVKTMQRGSPCRVVEVKDLESGYMLLTCEGALPGDAGPAFVVENLTWHPEVEVRNCTISRRHRARGILISTPRRAVIENNIFRTAGAAILIDGDTDVWYEAGAVRDLTIRGNIFENCCSSAEPGGWQKWGEAVICITPTHYPSDVNTEPYHQNIRIEGNTFRHYDYSLLYARSVRRLAFRNNRIERTTAYPMHGRPVNFLLDGCREVDISGNVVDESFPGRNCELQHMRPSDVRVGEDQHLSVSVAERDAAT